MSRSWAEGSTRAWRRLRETILARDQHTCRIRLPGCTGRAEHAHHTLGRSITGDDPAHLIAACAHCNLKTGAPKISPRPQGGTKW